MVMQGFMAYFKDISFSNHMTLFSILSFFFKFKHVFLISILLIVITKTCYELKYAGFHKIEKIIQTSSKKVLEVLGCAGNAAHIYCLVESGLFLKTEKQLGDKYLEKQCKFGWRIYFLI